ncbi:MAG: TolC family protein [Planctomycetota bacterium]
MIATALCLACSAEHYRQQADEQVYQLIERTQKDALGGPRESHIEPPANPLRDQLLEPAAADSPRTSRLARKLADSDALQARMKSLALEDALVIAAENSREYQDARELVFQRGLELTFQQYVFSNRWFGVLSADYRRNGPGQDGRSSEAVDGSANVGFFRTLEQGAQITASLLTTFLKQLTNPRDSSSGSLFSLAITQPLLRGAGRKIVEEPLIQAERNLVYAVRDFERFRRSLAVQVARQFFNTVQAETELVNEHRNKDRLRLARERTQEMAKAGRLPQFQVDQAQQTELSSDSRIITADQRYQGLLDSLKITLGLPTDTELAPAANVYEDLTSSGLEPIELSEEDALRIALARRLDLETARDRLEDADRQIVVAEDALQAGLDISGSIDLGTRPKQPLRFDPDETDYGVGVRLDLPLDRLRERNTYRAALILLEQRKRDLSALEDQIKLDVRDSLRTLNQAAENYKIQVTSASLARRRVDSTGDLLQAGRATTRDVLDSQDALIRSQNALARALVDYKIALLSLQQDMETLAMPEQGLNYVSQ